MQANNAFVHNSIPGILVGGWEHLFIDGFVATVRFAANRETQELISMQVLDGEHYRDANQDEFSDVADSLKNANDEAFDAPDAFGFVIQSELPGWAKTSNALK
jgi:hypothetical protein